MEKMAETTMENADRVAALDLLPLLEVEADGTAEALANVEVTMREAVLAI
jgi:hypothetical protein